MAAGLPSIEGELMLEPMGIALVAFFLLFAIFASDLALRD